MAKMAEEGTRRATLESLLQDHRELMKKVSELREWWSEIDELGWPNFGEMAMRIESFRDTLAAHFRDEEGGGYLSEALAVAPRFSEEAGRLQRQHAEFLQHLEVFADKLGEKEPPFRSWQAARGEFEQFLERLRRHEGRENAIVQSAFENDLGAGD